MNAQRVSLSDLLTLVRRKVEVVADQQYREIGVRSYGRGLFHKEPRSGLEVGNKDLFLVHEGDFILQVTFAWEGAVAVAKAADHGLYGSVRMLTFCVDETLCLPEFLQLYFRTPEGVEQLVRISPGSAGRNRVLNKSRLSEVIVPLPPLAEQRRIVAKIERLAGKIEEARGLREQASVAAARLIEAQTSVIFDALGDFPNVPIRQLGINGENPIQIGPFGAQLQSSEYVDNGIPVLNVGNVWPEGLRLDQLNYVTAEKADQLQRYTVATNDLLFARSGATLGKVCLVPEQCNNWLMTAHLFRVRFDRSRCLPEYAFAAFRGARQVRDQVFDSVRGATRPGFNTTLLSNVEIPLPPVEDQRRIVTAIKILGTRIGRLQTKQGSVAANLNALMSSILDQAFRGMD